MTQWRTPAEQWQHWAQDDRLVLAPILVVDAWDEELLRRLDIAAFVAGADPRAVATPAVAVSVSADSMPTLVRPAPDEAGVDDEDDAAATLVHGARVRDDDEAEAPSQLEVSLQAQGDALQIELTPPPAPSVGEHATTTAAARTDEAWFIPPLTDSARGMPQVGAVISGETVIAMPPSAPPEPTALRDDGPAIRTGTTLIPTEVEPNTSQTAGVIISRDDVFDEAEPPPPPPRRPSKIVIADAGGTQIAPSPLPEPPPVEVAEAIEAEIDPEMIESSDLLEAPEPPPMRPAPNRGEGPPPPPRTDARPGDDLDPATWAVDGVTPSTRPEPPPAPRSEPPPAPRVEPPPAPAPARPVELAPVLTGRTLPPGDGPHWSDAVFGAHYGALARVDADRLARLEAQFVLELAGISGAATVIDVGCGDGRHANAFSEAGARVVGLDASAAQLGLATDAHGPSLPNLRWHHGDVRDRAVQEQFDLVTCLGSTYGIYDDVQNRRVLEGVRELCRPLGRVVLQVLNRDHAVPRLPARTWWQGNRCVVLDEADLDARSSRVQVKRTIVFEDGRQFEHVYAVRLYAVHELAADCEAVGLRVLEVSGSRHTRGRFFGATSPDIWLTAERR